MTTVLNVIDLEGYLPHRGINLLPDEMTIEEEGVHGITKTCFTADDVRGRGIFWRDDGTGGQCWYEPFIAELMALTGVPLLAKELAAEGKISVFSMISNITVHADAPLGKDIIGETRLVRRRRGFATFASQAFIRGENGNELVFEGEVMSGAAALADVAAAPVRPLAATNGEAVEQAVWKEPAFTFCHEITEHDDASLTAVYRYPEDHPLVPGHFPDAPLMMGVTQWAAVADAALQLKKKLGIAGPITVNGRAYREDGSEVVNVRDLTLDDSGAGGIPRILSTKRIAFREPIRPGDGVFIEVKLA